MTFKPSPAFPLLYRNTDPPESAVGAQEALRDGGIGRARDAAFKAVLAHPGLTCSELEGVCLVAGRTYGRRLGELEKLGWVVRGESRRCRITGKKAAIWNPA